MRKYNGYQETDTLNNLALYFSLETPYPRAAQPDILYWGREQRAAERSHSAGEEAISSSHKIFQGHLATWRSASLWKQLQLLQDHFTSKNRQRQVKPLFTMIIRTSKKQWSMEGVHPNLNLKHVDLESACLGLTPRTPHTNISFPPTFSKTYKCFLGFQMFQVQVLIHP